MNKQSSLSELNNGGKTICSGTCSQSSFHALNDVFQLKTVSVIF